MERMPMAVTTPNAWHNRTAAGGEAAKPAQPTGGGLGAAAVAAAC